MSDSALAYDPTVEEHLRVSRNPIARAAYAVLGFVFLVSVYVLSQAAGLRLIPYILSQVFTYGAFALIVIFQQEIRTALARLGRSRLFQLFARREQQEVAASIDHGHVVADSHDDVGAGAPHPSGEPLDQPGLFREMLWLLETLDLEQTIFRSDHASNYLVLKGTLNRDKQRLLDIVRQALERPGSVPLRPEWARGL